MLPIPAGVITSGEVTAAISAAAVVAAAFLAAWAQIRKVAVDKEKVALESTISQREEWETRYSEVNGKLIRLEERISQVEFEKYARDDYIAALRMHINDEKPPPPPPFPASFYIPSREHPTRVP